MKLQLDISIPAAETKFNHGDELLFFGSCFADEVSAHLAKAGHKVHRDFLGTVFHPTPLAYNILRFFESDSPSLLQRDDLFFLWQGSERFFDYDSEKLLERYQMERQSMLEKIQRAKFLFVTFGSAWGYELKATEEIVANCHKMPAQEFEKFLATPYEMVQDWIQVMDKIRSVNPDIHFVFTVSPVIHAKDGIAENAWSKARLIEVANQLSYEPQATYFPSYEIVTHVLHDYRFFKADLVHPNELATEQIVEYLVNTYCDESTRQKNAEVLKLRKRLEHVSEFPDSAKQQLFEQETQRLVEAFCARHPEIELKG